MRCKLSFLLIAAIASHLSAQVATHNLLFQKEQIKLSQTQKKEIYELMPNLMDGQSLIIYPVYIDDGNQKLVFSKHADLQAEAIIAFTKTIGFETLGTPRGFPCVHKGVSMSANLKYHKSRYLDNGEKPYSLQANYPEKESQYFLINPMRDTTIYGKEGTEIHIPTTALTSRKLVSIKLKEFYSLADLMINDLSTVSDGEMIQTGGSIYLEAREHQTEKKVTINPNLGLDIAFTGGREDPKMEVFIKDPHSAKMNWIRPRKTEVTMTKSWSMTETILDPETNEVISSKTYNSKKEWEDHLNKKAEEKKTADIVIAKKKANYEKLKVYDMGYINCDRFPDEPKIQFMVAADDNIVAEYFVVFDNVRGVLKGETRGNSVDFGTIPSDKAARLIAVSFQGDKTYFYSQNFIAKNTPNAKVALRPVPKSVVDQQLAMLK
tara:strand:+ start:1952 stop:3256 length:1305 start_codon:yes stop_codon:yes gene_type:complete